jgi:hypothetical protein
MMIATSGRQLQIESRRFRLTDATPSHLLCWSAQAFIEFEPASAASFVLAAQAP